MRKSLAVIVVAAGSGQRARMPHQSLPKQYVPLAGTPILSRSIAAFAERSDVDWIVPVIAAQHTEHYSNLALALPGLLPPVIGGTQRQASVLAGLESLAPQAPDLVLIHDAARPLVTRETIDQVVETLQSFKAALPVARLTDTIKHSSDGETTDGTEDRSLLRAAQTPQGFAYRSILDAHRSAAHSEEVFTDDASIAEWAGIPVKMTEGSTRNIKVTEPEDFALAAWMLEDGSMETRTGTGLDIHRFVPGDMVRLAEVDIPHTKRLDGHSDADAALHVLTDALLGALAEGDIGRHFPPSDAQWKGEPSRTFLQFAAARVRESGGRIVHLDLTLMCEAPKIGPHADVMSANIAAICGISARRVSVKATTAERMGFVGRGEGLFAHGTATIEIPRGDD